MPGSPGGIASRDAPRLASVAVIGVAALTCVFLNWPGHLSYDSVVQLSEGRTGSYSGEHPPVMSWLLGLADAVLPGAGLFVVFDVALVFGALAALVWMGRPGVWRAAILAALAAFTPQLIVYPAIVWKDVLFAGAMVAGFAALAWAAANWTADKSKGGRWRWLWVAKSAALLSLAALSRQNGALVLPIAAVAVAWIAARGGAGLGRAVLSGAGFFAATVIVVAAASLALATRLEDAGSLGEAWQSLESYDIVAATARDPHFDLAVLHARAPAAETLVRTEGVAAYTPERIDTLEPVFDKMGAGGDISGLIGDQWRDLVLRHPWLYLQVRAQAFEWVFLTPKPDACVMLETGVDGPAYEMGLAGLQPRDTPRDEAIAGYALKFAATPVFSHAAYALVGAAVGLWLLRRRRPADLAVLAMLASGFAFAASFAVISIACDYRYLYALDLSAIAASLYAVASGVRRPAR